jgi:hypothetical protein
MAFSSKNVTINEAAPLGAGVHTVKVTGVDRVIDQNNQGLPQIDISYADVKTGNTFRQRIFFEDKNNVSCFASQAAYDAATSSANKSDTAAKQLIHLHRACGYPDLPLGDTDADIKALGKALIGKIIELKLINREKEKDGVVTNFVVIPYIPFVQAKGAGKLTYTPKDDKLLTKAKPTALQMMQAPTTTEFAEVEADEEDMTFTAAVDTESVVEPMNVVADDESPI